MFELETAAAALLAFGITALLGFVMIPFLHKIHFGQTIKEIGPTWHKNKQGTPTMGGLMFIAGITLAVTAGWFLIPAGEKTANLPDFTAGIRLFAGLGFSLLMGLGGFLDDFISVVKKRNLGLRARDKILIQVIGTVAYLVVMTLWGGLSTSIWFPFIGLVDFGWLFYPVAAFLIVGFVNAVQITDGIDGLCGSVSFVYAIAFMVITGLAGSRSMSMLSVAMAAGCLGYLLWNFHPAKVFMGDTGSMFLGGLVVSLVFGMEKPLLLFLCGFVYLCEALSDIIQVGYYKLTHKRVFKMAPIHHHFEMSGWSENKIVAVFSLVTALGSAVGILACVLA